MRLTYSAKARITKYTLPLLVIIPFALGGYKATRSLFAAPVAIPSNYLSVGVEQPEYQVGQVVTATITNDSSIDLYVNNNCPGEPLAVYRREGKKWVRVHATASVAHCQGQPSDYKIPANTTISVDYRYWPQLFAQPGRYRIELPAEFARQTPMVDLSVVK